MLYWCEKESDKRCRYRKSSEEHGYKIYWTKHSRILA
jgi:hypothetical protein